ncbi:hypothetical protein PAMA_012562 [Pampus argenteus]
MTWKSQPVGRAGLCGVLSSRKTSESSLAASYLVLVGVKIQGMNLSLTPACKQTKYRGKDEHVSPLNTTPPPEDVDSGGILCVCVCTFVYGCVLVSVCLHVCLISWLCQRDVFKRPPVEQSWQSLGSADRKENQHKKPESGISKFTHRLSLKERPAKAANSTPDRPPSYRRRSLSVDWVVFRVRDRKKISWGPKSVWLSSSFFTCPPVSHPINSRGTLNMAPGRRVTERMGQLVASVAMGRLRPSILPGWVGGIWRPRQGPLWCDTHTHTERHTEGLEPPRLGSRSPWETWCHQASDRGGVVCMCACDPTLKATPTPPPENVGHCPPPHPHGDSAVVSAHQN